MTQPSLSSAFCIHASLMKPLSNISLSNIGFSLHSRLDYLNATVCFSLAARSYNDKLEAWEPLVEPVDGTKMMSMLQVLHLNYFCCHNDFCCHWLGLRCSPKYPCLYMKNCILGSTYLLIWDLQSISSIFSVDGVLSDNPVTPSATFRKGKPLIISFEGAIGEFPGCSDSTYRGLCKQQKPLIISFDV
ncbi:unnamed protein product [Lactuca saligna]|uniref:Uncharacterized protein n=1 Tax=Lactuca saligna TaxID=75948 RepID=A0AA35VRV8_LACSI|nr:unnamed protein product [Lactuca saligna]